MEHTEVVLAEGIARLGKEDVFLVGGGIVSLFVGDGGISTQDFFFAVAEVSGG